MNIYDIMVIVRHDLMGSFPLQMADHGLSMRVTYYFPKKKHQPHLTKQVQNQTKHVNVRNTKNLNMLLWEGTKMVKGPPKKKCQNQRSEGIHTCATPYFEDHPMTWIRGYPPWN